MCTGKKHSFYGNISALVVVVYLYSTSSQHVVSGDLLTSYYTDENSNDLHIVLNNVYITAFFWPYLALVMHNSNQIGNASNKVVSASDCTCHVIPVQVGVLSSWGEPDAMIMEEQVECQACIDTLIADSPDDMLEHLDQGMAYRYLYDKYSIKCTYMQEKVVEDLPF